MTPRIGACILLRITANMTPQMTAYLHPTAKQHKHLIMKNAWKIERPKEVRRAVWVVVAWSIWMCLFGIYQTWRELPMLQTMLDTQLQGLIAIDPADALKAAVAGYGVIALTMLWVAYKLDAGKKWARSTLLFSFALEVLIAAAPPYHDLLGYLQDVPDWGLQIYALYLLYTWPGRTWFNPVKIEE
jgi:hypothetical protein